MPPANFKHPIPSTYSTTVLHPSEMPFSFLGASLIFFFSTSAPFLWLTQVMFWTLDDDDWVLSMGFVRNYICVVRWFLRYFKLYLWELTRAPNTENQASQGKFCNSGGNYLHVVSDYLTKIYCQIFMKYEINLKPSFFEYFCSRYQTGDPAFIRLTEVCRSKAKE